MNTEGVIITETRMIDLFNTDYKDYKDGCAALHKIHIIRVDKKYDYHRDKDD